MLRKSAKVQLLERVPLFSRCTKRELNALALQADQLGVPAKRELTKQGEVGREFIVLVSGAAEVRKNGRLINRLGPGDFLGEIALLSGSPRTATVLTTEPSEILVLTSRDFDRVVKEIPQLRASLLAALSERLEATSL